MKKVYLYHKYERFWHWSQALLIIIMMITGFEIHGLYRLLGFRTAAQVHNIAAFALIILVIFTIFWHFMTGEWKQYLPTRRNLGAMVWYYLVGIFQGASHPTMPSPVSKLNPLQRLSYLAFKLLIFPVMATTGLLYFFFNSWATSGVPWSLGAVALLHTVGAFLLVGFLILHVYMTTTGRTVFSNIKAMFTGYKKIGVEDEIPAQGAQVGERGKRIIQP
jgi:thiosulfate reductase cytochrome b subunit